MKEKKNEEAEPGKGGRERETIAQVEKVDVTGEGRW